MQLSQSSRSRRLKVLAAVAATTLSVTTVLPAPAHASSRTDVLQAAADYAAQQGYHVGIAVLDTQTGRLQGAGYWKGIFASESLIKVFIATRLLVEHRMHGSTESRAWKMITQSDDAIASAFYNSVGGDNLVNWMKARYHVPDLGYPPSRAGWWGNTHLRPSGLVKLYAKLKRDRIVAPWLLNAMHHARPHGSDGVYQFFGIPSATKGFGVKQGWGNDYEIGSSSDFNSTGFINHDRYAVAILARGPSYDYGAPISNLLTQVARRLLPGGFFPDPQPHLTSIYPNTGASVGGTRVTVHGSNFTHVTKVMFGDKAGRDLRVVSGSTLFVTAPNHSRANTFIRVLTNHGDTGRAKTSRFVFEPPPTITTMSAHSGRAAGGATVVINGGAYSRVHQVLFGTTPAASVTRLSRWRLKVVVPKHDAGTVNVHVVTQYGRSIITSADRYTYIAPPTITSVDHDSGNAVKIVGTAFRPGTTVTIGGHPATGVTRSGTTLLKATGPAGTPGDTVAVVVTTPFGTATHGYTY